LLAQEDPRVNALARTLDEGAPLDKINACNELAKMGPDVKKQTGKLIARTCFESTPQVAQAALAALEKVWPEMYEAGVALQKDTDDKFGVSEKRQKACEAIIKMPDGDAGLPFLINHLRVHLEKDDDFHKLNTALTPNIEAIKKFDLGNKDFQKILLAAASANNRKHKNRALAVQTLGELGEANPTLRRQFIPTLKAACNAICPDPRQPNHPKNNVEPVRVAGIEGLAKFGKDAQDQLSMLRKLKTDPNEAVRRAATSAVDTLEAAK
jgi:hypothetical protein